MTALCMDDEENDENDEESKVESGREMESEEDEPMVNITKTKY